MSATGVIWLSAFSLIAGLLLSVSPRFWERRLVAAWYLWLGGVGLSGLIVGQVIVALLRTGRFRLDDPGPPWLGLAGFDLSLSVDPRAAYGMVAVLLIVLVTAALVTQVGVRLESADRSALSRLALVAGGAGLVMSGRSFIVIAAGWVLCARSMSGGRVDPRAKAWSLIGDLGVVLFAFALFTGAEIRDLLPLLGLDLGQVRAPLWGSLPTAEVAVGGLAAAIFARVMAPTGAFGADGGAGAYAIARLFAGAVIPWVVLSLRAGKLLAHAPWAMVAITLAGLALMLSGVVRVLQPAPADHGQSRVVGYARACAAVPVVAVGLGHADLAMYAAVIGAGNAVTFALARGRVPMRGLGRWAAWAWLGVGPWSWAVALVGVVGWARGHDAAASMAINYVAWLMLALAAVGLGVGLARARVDTHDGAAGAEELRLGSRAALVWGLLTWPLVWPSRVGGPSSIGESLGVVQSYGSVFVGELTELHVGLRPEFSDAVAVLRGRELLLAIAVVLLAAGLSHLLARRSDPEASPTRVAGWMRAALRLEVALASMPAALLGAAGVWVREGWRLLAERIPKHAGELLAQWRSDGVAATRRRPFGGAWRSLPLVAMALVLVVFGWLYLRPSVTTLGPSDFHGFGGLRPELQHPRDPSRERAREAARRSEAQAPTPSPADAPSAEGEDTPGGLAPVEVPQ